MVQADAYVDSYVTETLAANQLLLSDNFGQTVKCVKCGLSISHIKVEGVVLAVVATNSIISALLTVTTTMTSDLLFSFYTIGPDGYSFETSLGSLDLQALNVPNIFVIS